MRRPISFYSTRRAYIQCVCSVFIRQERDVTIDIKLFSLALLLSSMFVFNQYVQITTHRRLGHIDEQSIENLSLVVNLSENVSVG